ncbi:hypothetical protein Tasa_002_021 [Tanticharoenia sakaeratensis NBRC 103193]|uniref:Uncharacterized protein n=1 Tax=Tanticharoenia sakaeratensis NBRC 103193 TaxID=1231623 RepID=A0A0D6MGX6_9PROT|nr:hypothetical protein Tasa_002_021 [Tanticharoenia sakaeratensis NBRC 103193]GBQ17886.1 hypothetical protein AA103193_0506 [Tanticharoenia sakaeratensis NBRC 103193]
MTVVGRPFGRRDRSDRVLCPAERADSPAGLDEMPSDCLMRMRATGAGSGTYRAARGVSRIVSTAVATSETWNATFHEACAPNFTIGLAIAVAADFDVTMPNHTLMHRFRKISAAEATDGVLALPKACSLQ